MDRSNLYTVREQNGYIRLPSDLHQVVRNFSKVLDVPWAAAISDPFPCSKSKTLERSRLQQVDVLCICDRIHCRIRVYIYLRRA